MTRYRPRVAERGASYAVTSSASRSDAARRITVDDPGYPDGLTDLPTPPLLWGLGDPSLLADGPLVAIVGTRGASAYGEQVARDLARAVVEAGGCVVSGLARGVDAAAHRGALDGGGRTIAVLPGGVGQPYPPTHRRLHHEIVARGLVVSEFDETQRLLPHLFLRRNRIIAGLAVVTVVVEAPHRSGALDTAARSLDLGRQVAAVPGPIDAPTSLGANRLIRDGAHPITEIDDLLTLAGLARRPPVEPEPIEPVQRRIREALASGALSIDAIMARTGLPASACMAAVTAMELAGRLECSLRGTIRLR